MTHTDHYVGYDWGDVHLHMRQDSFMAVTAARFSTFQDSPQMDHESAVYWFEKASKEGVVYL